MKTSGLKVIGKGLFTICYKLNDKEVLLRSCDPIKECMSMGWFPESKYFPTVERIDSELYKMEYYEKVKSLKDSLKPAQYKLYSELRKLQIPYCKNNYDLKDAWYKEFSKVTNITLRNSLQEAIDACANYGSDIKFEISPRNVAVKNGNLILLDCFFVGSKQIEVTTSKRKNYRF